MKRSGIPGAMAMVLLSSQALAGAYHVSPDGDDAGNGTSSPWRTIQHAVVSLPPGENSIELAPGTYLEDKRLDLSRTASSNLTIKSRDPGNPAVITCSGSHSVALISGKMNGGSLSFRDVRLINSNAASLVHVDVQNLNLLFDHCALNGNSAILETTAQASGVRINFQESSMASARHGLSIGAAAEIALTKCKLAWDGAAFIQGVGSSNTFGRVVFDGCAVNGSPSARFFSVGNTSRRNIDLFQVSGCTGTCGKLSYDQGGVGRMLVTSNNIHWTDPSTITIGAGIEVRNGQTKPVVNPAPCEKIIIAHNIFYFTEGTTHHIFLGKGTDHTDFVDNLLICPKAAKYGVVVKSDHNLFEFNVIYGGRNAFYLAGASHNRLRHNTIYSYQRPALLIDANQERSVPPTGTYGQSRSNEVTANILVAAGPAFMHDAGANDDSPSWNTSCDGNVYWNTAGKDVMVLNGVAFQQTNGIAAVQAGWGQYGKAGTMRANDRISIIADPLVSSPPEDFSLKPGSPALHPGGGSSLNAGAWQDSRGNVSGHDNAEDVNATITKKREDK